MTTANQPNSRTIRKHLRLRGLEHLVEGVTSGRSDTHVTISWPDDAPHPYIALGDSEERAQRVAEALRELWDDGADRVRVLYAGKVLVRRAGWHLTKPAPAEDDGWDSRHDDAPAMDAWGVV